MSFQNYRRILKIIVIQGVVVICMVLLFGEVFIRFKKNVSELLPRHLKERSIEYAPSIFARHVFPQKEQEVVDMYWFGKWGNPTRRINVHGYRGKDFNFQKSPDIVRVIVYGGSAVFDLALPEGKDWPHRIEQYLHAAGLKNVEVINAGIPGHASFDSLGRFFSEGHLLEPDYVVLYHTWNDIKRFSSEESLLREMKPHAPESNPMMYCQNSVDCFLVEHSRLYLVLRQGYLKKRLGVGLEGAAQRKRKEYVLTQKALDQFRLDIELFVDCARNIGAEPILMTQGRLIEATNEEKEPYRLRHVRNMLPFDFSYEAFAKADEIIKAVVVKKKALFIDAAALLKEKDEMIYFDHVHLNDRGSKRIATLVAEKLEGLIWTSANIAR